MSTSSLFQGCQLSSSSLLSSSKGLWSYHSKWPNVSFPSSVKSYVSYKDHHKVLYNAMQGLLSNEGEYKSKGAIEKKYNDEDCQMRNKEQ